MFTNEEIKIANSTYRSRGSSVFDKDGNIRSVVARYIEKNIDKSKKILDFGCGPEFVQGKYLNGIGFNVSGWDFGENKPDNCVSKLEKVYDVVYASNVLNVISSKRMLEETLDQIYGCIKDGGVFIANYPQSPRKMAMNDRQLSEIVQNKFGGDIKRIPGMSCSMWVFAKDIITIKVGA